ncbi:MAG: hypothetical protein FWD36_01930, partial [Treponema sp.]|nr:hypothetical protein [Treponema sp.]
MSNNWSFLLGFISSIGLYRLFFSLNRPAEKWRSVALLVICVIKVPVIFIWKDLNMGYDVIPVYANVLLMVYELLALLAIVLLGTNRGTAVVSAAFFLCIINIVEYPVSFLMGAIANPSLSLINLSEELYKNSGFYYLFVFIINILLMSCCFIAARWLCKTKIDPHRKLVMLFSAVYISIVIIFLIWVRDTITIMSVSYLATALFTALFVGIQLMLFYFFTRIITKKEIAVLNGKDFGYTRFIQKLSKRELDVVEAVLAGYVSQKELALSLNISVNT